MIDEAHDDGPLSKSLRCTPRTACGGSTTKRLPKKLVQKLVEPVGLRCWHKVASVFFNLCQIGDEISLMGLDRFCLLDELPTEENDWEKENHHVAMIRQYIVHLFREKTYENKKFGTSHCPGRKTV